jgi:hypothetical protein
VITFTSDIDQVTVSDTGKEYIFPRSSVRINSYFRGTSGVVELRTKYFNELSLRMTWDEIDQHPFHDSQEFIDFCVDLFMGTTIAEARFIMSENWLILTTEDGKFLTTEG